MSNTCIGDVELSERTYPFIIRQYSLREGSGGNGRYKGGEGCIRAIEFTRAVDCAILSDRRTNPPYGMNGGEPGARGKNLWIRKRDGIKTTINLGGRNQMKCLAGDMVVISEHTICRGHARSQSNC
jgi:5-oxoprolinase (ATP-hydrolysing)